MSELVNGRTPEEILFNIRECAYGACLSECPYDSSDECMEDLLKDALALINHLESERDAALAKVPVVHARWTENGICTNCGNEAEYTEWVENLVDYDWDFNLRNFGEKVHRNHKLTNYCPNCGARMDGESEEER